MSSSETAPAREILHRRRIEITGYKREDGLYDIEGHLVDAKDVPFAVGGGVRQPGEPVHDMWLRLTVDREFRIVGAEARMLDMPYRGTCERIAPDYAKLVGLVIGPGYLRGLKERLRGVAGCTHLTELAGALATATFQTFAGQGLLPSERKPPQLDRCHALDTHGDVVRRFHPRWYRAPAAAGSGDNP